MEEKIPSKLASNINKIITLIFSTLFIFSLYIYQGIILPAILISIILVLLNIFNLLSSRNLSGFFELLIYESISLLGIFFISWYYVLVFVLVAETTHIFKRKYLLSSIIFINSVYYIVTYYVFLGYGVNRGFYPWHIFLSLFITIALSIYFVKSEENYREDNISNNDEEGIVQKYSELLKEHENILLLKEIMDMSNQHVELNDMIANINQLLVRNFNNNTDYTTIFLFDENRKNYRIVTSNVPVHFHKSLCNLDQFDEFDDVINKTNGKVLNSEFGLTYPTAVERGVTSALCVPLHTNKNLIGLILMESQTPNDFDDIDINKFNIVRYYISLVVENKQWVSKIEKMALIDGLTGVYNRNYLFDFLTYQLKWHNDNSKQLCLVLFDIDHFKKFNDTYGHLFGDLVLKEISNLVKNSIRDIDLVARYGGEEFIIILVDTDINTAKERIEEIRMGIQNMVVMNEEGVSAKVTVSFGIAEFGQKSYNIKEKELIERADQALYKSKNEGRNRVTIYTENN